MATSHTVHYRRSSPKGIVGTQCIPYTLPCNHANIVQLQVNGSKYGGILLSIVESN